MKQILPVLFAFSVVVVALSAQEGDLRFGPAQKDIDAVLVPSTPASPDTVTGSRTIYVNEITLTNITNADVYCTIVDKQSPARQLFGADNATIGKVPAGAIGILDFKGRKMTGGITWSCSSSNAIVGYVQYTLGRF